MAKIYLMCGKSAAEKLLIQISFSGVGKTVKENQNA